MINLKARFEGFSLVEVVIAIGIASSAILISLALFGYLTRNQGEVVDDKAALDSLGALNTFMASYVSFQEAYTWAHEEGRLFYPRYPYNDALPSTPSRPAKWIRADDEEITNAPTSAGRWVLAILKLDDELNPIKTANLPGSPEDYPEAMLVFKASLYVVPSPDITDISAFRPTLELPVTVNR